MNRKQFLNIIAGTTGMITLGSFNKISELLAEEDEIMPVLFIGHGSPMNAIEDNQFTKRWSALGKEIRKPKAVLCISAHWLTNGTHVTSMEKPRTIHDFGGFPKALFDVQYPAPGSKIIADETIKLVKKTGVLHNHDWGLDHGTWSVVKNMYPDADIPVLQLSIDYSQPLSYHYELAKELAGLRKKGVLIIGSGNMVHNLGMVAWDKLNTDAYGYDWAIEMNTLFKKHITERNDAALIDYTKISKSAILAVPTTDHYIPLIYTLGLRDNKDEALFFNDKPVGGSLTMTSVSFSQKAINHVIPEEKIKDSLKVRDSLGG